MPRDKRRRDIIKGIGAAGLAGLAGCGGGDGTATPGDDGEDTPTDTPTPSPTEGGMDGTDTPEGTDTATEAPGTTAAGTAQPRTLNVGILMGVTGGLSQLGPPIRNAAELAADYINDQSDTFTVDYQFEDTATDPNTGIEGGNALINAGYPAIAGALSSTVTLQVAQNVAIPNGAVLCSPASTSPALTDLDDNDYVYRTTPTDALQSQVMAQVGTERLEGSTTAIMALNNDYGQGLADAYASAWEERGGTVQNRVNFEPGQSSYTSQLATVLADGPDVMMVVGYPESGVQIFRDFYSEYSQDFCDIIVPDGLQDGELPGNVGNSMRNVWGTAPASIGPSRETFNTLYDEAYDSGSGSPFVAQSFDAVAVLALANAAAGENTGSAIRDQMRNVANDGGTEVTIDNLAEGLEMAAQGQEVNYQGAAGAIQFDDAGDIAAATYDLYRYEEGGFEVIDQIEYSA
jgi:ABC-type branched-subunit amino acid transport system substrate-binding protein